jgi:hypothetical protein
VIPLTLVLLALVDGALLGFRAAAGRSGALDKGAYYRRAVALGAAYAGAVAAGGVALALALSAAGGASVWAALVTAGRAAAAVYAAFAAVVLAALAVWAVPITEVRTIASVTVLGPGTLLRPWVVLAGLAWAVAMVPRWEVATLALYAAVGMLPLEAWITRRHFPIDATLCDEG